MHYFQGSREHRPPWGPQYSSPEYVAGAFHKLRRARQEEYKSQCAGCPLSGKVREISFFQGQGKVRKFSHATVFIVPTQPVVTSL